MSRLSKLLLILLVGILLLAPLNSLQGKPEKPKKGGVLNYFLGEPVAIDPLNVQDSEGIQVAKELFDGLVDYDSKTLALKPAVAKSWKSDKKARVFTFFLRKGVKFHNGREVTAGDFKYAWERVAQKDSGSQIAYLLAAIKGFEKMQSGKAKELEGVKAKGKYSLEVSLNYSFAEFPFLLGHPVFSPVPKEEIQKNPNAFTQKPVGNGPFMMVKPWKHQQLIAVKRFDNYYGSNPYLKGVNFRIFESEETAFLEFKSGTLDVTSIPLGQVRATIEEFGSNAVVGQPQLVLNFYGFNLRKKPFNNRDFRKALNFSVDRKAIATTVFEGTRVAAYSILPPSLEKYKPPRGVYRYDLERAKSFLRKAGYPNGKGLSTLKLSFPTTPGNEAPAQILQANLRDIGINVELEALEFGAFIDALRRGKLTFFSVTWGADYPTRDNFLYSLFYSKGSDNIFGYKNKKVDELLLKARKSPKKSERLRLYQQAEAEVLKDAPVVPVVFVGSRVIHGKNVKGFISTPLGNLLLEKVWLDK